MQTVCHLVPGPTYTVRHKSVLPSTTLYLVIIRGRVAVNDVPWRSHVRSRLVLTYTIDPPTGIRAA